MNKILLDTNAYTSLLVGDRAVLGLLASVEIAYMSIFVLGELHAGFAGGTKEAENKKVLDDFLRKATVKILNATAETASTFGFVKNSLRRAGTPIPINNVWIAAHALESGATLVTYDAHFKKVAGLRMWSAEQGST